MNLKKGFTLIELLVVVAIIGILASVVLAALNSARNKGSDAGIKANLRNALSQGEVFYATNTATRDSYTGVCTNPGPVGGANTVAAFMLAAAKDTGLASYTSTPTVAGTWTTATCHDSANAWAAEVPLSASTSSASVVWCVDSTGKSKQESGSNLGASDYNCN